jgi:hypothetical protein
VRYALALTVVVLGWIGGQAALGAQPPDREGRSQRDDDRQTGKMVFDGDPQHPWNRLHRSLYSRTTQEGVVYDQESLEPLFLSGSKFLTEGLSYRQASSLLDEFLRTGRRTDQGPAETRDLATRSLGRLFGHGRRRPAADRKCADPHVSGTGPGHSLRVHLASEGSVRRASRRPSCRTKGRDFLFRFRDPKR